MGRAIRASQHAVSLKFYFRVLRSKIRSVICINLMGLYVRKFISRDIVGRSKTIYENGGREGSAGIATGLWTGVIRFPAQGRDSFFPAPSGPVVVSIHPSIHPSILLSDGYWRDLSPEIKRPKYEAHHSRPFNVRITNAWNYTSIPLFIIMAWCLIKYRGMFILHIPEWDTAYLPL
jgi:hypothetical protein